MEVSGQLNSPATLPPWIGGWVGPRVCMDATEERKLDNEVYWINHSPQTSYNSVTEYVISPKAGYVLRGCCNRLPKRVILYKETLSILICGRAARTAVMVTTSAVGWTTA
jgi:hypothetical protein